MMIYNQTKPGTVNFMYTDKYKQPGIMVVSETTEKFEAVDRKYFNFEILRDNAISRFFRRKENKCFERLGTTCKTWFTGDKS